MLDGFLGVGQYYPKRYWPTNYWPDIFNPTAQAGIMFLTVDRPFVLLEDSDMSLPDDEVPLSIE